MQVLIEAGDCRDLMRALPDASVQACITSPSYFAQRAYLPLDVARLRARLPEGVRERCLGGVEPWAGTGVFRLSSVPEALRRHFEPITEMGHEETLDAYAASLVEVFRGVRRVLRRDGTAWIVLGDTFYSGTPQGGGLDPRCPSRDWMRAKRRSVDTPGWGIPTKSLLGVPWRVAHALQRDGWTVRAEVVWNKAVALAEPSAKDRPHRQHETVFLLSKGPKYLFDRSALPEESVWNIPLRRQSGPGNRGHNAAFPEALAERCIASTTRPGDTVLDPFLGTGTTAVVGRRMGRRVVGFEQNPEFTELARRRLSRNAPTEGGVMAGTRLVGNRLECAACGEVEMWCQCEPSPLRSAPAGQAKVCHICGVPRDGPGKGFCSAWHERGAPSAPEGGKA